MFDDGDVGAPGARRRPAGFAFQDPELASVAAAQCRRRIRRDIGIVAGAVNSAAVGLVGRRDRAGEYRYPGQRAVTIAYR